MTIAIVVATLGRPTIVDEFLSAIEMQTRTPDVIIISAESASDLPARVPPSIVVLLGPRGAAKQRNLGLEHCLGRYGVVVFLDDDYVPSRYFVENVAALFERHPAVSGATGLVLFDGVGTQGISHHEAERLVRQHDEAQTPNPSIVDSGWTYGCNMAFRCDAVGDIRFDENLPLYSWQEDVDFSGRMSARGRIVKTDALAGVHRGVTNGRTTGVRFGYSQVVNPIYLVRKGTMRLGHAAGLITRNLLANHAKSLKRSGPIDRRGRMKGNWIGILDVLSGRADPRRILQL